MHRKHRTLLLIPILCVVAATAGCTPRQTAVMGVGVDDGGSPVAYVVACSESIDVLTLTQPGRALLGEWAAPESVTGMASVRLGEPEPGWTALGRSTAELESGITYELSGREDGRDAVTAMEVEFTVQDLAALEPGEIRRRAGVNAEGDRSYVVETEDQFAENACGQLR